MQAAFCLFLVGNCQFLFKTYFCENAYLLIFERNNTTQKKQNTQQKTTDNTQKTKTKNENTKGEFCAKSSLLTLIVAILFWGPFMIWFVKSWFINLIDQYLQFFKGYKSHGQANNDKPVTLVSRCPAIVFTIDLCAVFWLASLLVLYIYIYIYSFVFIFFGIEMNVFVILVYCI